MFSFSPSLEHQDAVKNIQTLLSPCISVPCLQQSIQKLQRSFNNFIKYCPSPWPSPGLQLTAEIHYQSELWLPLSEIRPVFYKFFRSATTYQPIVASTPFATASSWAGIVAETPAALSQNIINPAKLLERLLTDKHFRTEFIFWSFMPERYYGNSSNRYPEQMRFILTWLADKQQKTGRFNILDAACGDGSYTYTLAGELLKQGINPERFSIEGWTLDPLEAWSAAHASFPHDPNRQKIFRRNVQSVFTLSAAASVLFRQADLRIPSIEPKVFDLIICNGLLGGPIINRFDEMNQIIRNLAANLAVGGLLLTADCFHGGWKQKCPQEKLRALFKLNNLKAVEAGEGICGIKHE